MTFKELAVGDTFDWLGGQQSYFPHRCIKVSARCYTWEENGKTLRTEVGTIKAPVYHVEGGSK